MMSTKRSRDPGKNISEYLTLDIHYFHFYCYHVWANSVDDKLMLFYLFFPLKTGFGISCKLSPLETICMKCQNLFSGKNEKKKFNINVIC